MGANEQQLGRRLPGTSRRAGVRQVVPLVLAALLLAGALSYALWGTGGDQPAPNDQFIDFRCRACGHEFRLSYSEFEQLWNQRRFAAQEDGRSLRYQCPKCKQMAAERVGIGAKPFEPAPRDRVP